MTSPIAPTFSPPAAGLPLADRLRATFIVGAQLGLILVIVYSFEVAAQNQLFPVLCLAVGGFLIHAWVPVRWRPALFPLVSVGGVLFILGWPTGGWVLGLGGGLIAVCYLPIPLAMRVLVVVVLAFALSLARMDLDRPFWPVLGSMFLFRMIVYLYDLRRVKGRPPLLLTVAYFFPLPNVGFLFFPILDFQTFRDTYRPAASWADAQGGVRWIAVGLSHLLAYRLIKYYVLPAPHELGDLPHLALFLAANYALYLHVSAHFHIITGVFHLFGYELPRTHNHYFLASSFTDVWRRINIYWKDFMTKVFFLPAFFTLRRLGTPVAVAGAALGVFAATWLLHSVQVFWLTGGLPLSLNVAALWLAAGALVGCNLYLDLRRAGRPARRELTLRGATVLSLQVVGMFVLVSLFWACWNAPAAFVFFRAQLADGPRLLGGGAVVMGALLAAVFAGVVAQFLRDRLTRWRLLPLSLSPTASALGLTAALVAAALLGTPQAAGLLGPTGGRALASLRRESETPVEAALAVQGYYEEAMNTRTPVGSWLAALQGRPKPPDGFAYTTMTRPTDDLLERELIPGWSGDVDGAPTTVNRLGMRDRPDRSQEKAPGTCRVAVVGSSIVMGYGVADGEAFPALLEGLLNARRRDGEPRFEVLNFGTGRSFAIHRHVLFDRKVQGFRPDVLLYVAHQDEFLGTVQHLAKLLERRRPLPYPCLEETVRKAGITAETSAGLAHALLQNHAPDLVSGLYRDLARECRQRGIVPVWVSLPMPGVTDAPARQDGLARLAGKAGFEVVDLTGWEGDHRPADVKREGDQYHPNALGHRLIAERIDRALRDRPELLPCAGPGRGKAP
ncbi:MAG: hypothetical protein U0797_11945 [Gemmataceae bacterium]